MQLNKITSLKSLISAGIRRYILFTGMNLLPFSFLRIYLLRFCGIKVGKGCYVGFNVIPDTNFPELIKIGKKVTISHNVNLITHTATQSKVVSQQNIVFRRILSLKMVLGLVQVLQFYQAQ